MPWSLREKKVDLYEVNSLNCECVSMEPHDNILYMIYNDARQHIPKYPLHLYCSMLHPLEWHSGQPSPEYDCSATVPDVTSQPHVLIMILKGMNLKRIWVGSSLTKYTLSRMTFYEGTFGHFGQILCVCLFDLLPRPSVPHVLSIISRAVQTLDKQAMFYKSQELLIWGRRLIG